MLSALTSMSVARNNLRELPLELPQLLPRLAVLDVSNNLLCDSGRGRRLFFPRTLTRLDASSNQLGSITDLVALTALRSLMLNENRIMSLGVLRRVVNPFPVLAELRLASNWIKSLRGLECIPALEVVDVRHNSIAFAEDLAPLRELPRLREALVQGNPVAGSSGNSTGPSGASSIADGASECDDSALADAQQRGALFDEEEEEEADEHEAVAQPQQQQQQQPRRAPVVTVSSPSSPKAQQNRTPLSAAPSNRTRVPSYTAAFVEKKRQEEEAPVSNSNSTASNPSAAAAAAAAVVVDESGEETLLEFERKASSEVRQEAQRLARLLRETRAAAASSAQSVRELRKDNDALRARVKELEEQRDKDRVAHAGARQRTEARLKSVTEEHQRVCIAQEAEIQELRLELEAMSKRLARSTPSAAGTSPATTTASGDAGGGGATEARQADAASVFEAQLRQWIRTESRQ